MSKIRVENIVKTFNRHSRNANKVLKGVSFELPDKGLVCIFGKSGSGKTTLLNIIGGLEKADSGKVYIDGECTSGKTDPIRNAKIGFIFQNYSSGSRRFLPVKTKGTAYARAGGRIRFNFYRGVQ